MSQSDKQIHKRSLKNSWKASKTLYKEPVHPKGKLVKQGISQEKLLSENSANFNKHTDLYGEKNEWISKLPRPYTQFPDNSLMDVYKRKYVCEYTVNEKNGVFLYSYSTAKQVSRKSFSNTITLVNEDPKIGEELLLKKGNETVKLKVISVSRDTKRKTGVIECKHT